MKSEKSGGHPPIANYNESPGGIYSVGDKKTTKEITFIQLQSQISGPMHIYLRLCPSVRRSIHRSVTRFSNIAEMKS